MSDYGLQLLEDQLGPDVMSPLLPPLNRVIYVVQGGVTVAAGQQDREVAENSAWFGPESCTVRAGTHGARMWRWELVKTPDDHLANESVTSQLKQYEVIDLDTQAEYLMRCDRVDFPLGGVAYLHTHRGPGIRCLLHGEINIRVKEQESLIRPGESWFESGPDPVFAAASATHLTSFVRAMILPRSLKGQSSIHYVNAEDRDKPKTQQYTRFVDERIEI